MIIILISILLLCIFNVFLIFISPLSTQSLNTAFGVSVKDRGSIKYLRRIVVLSVIFIYFVSVLYQFLR